MKPTRPIYKKLLVIAAILWVISTTIYVADLYFRVGNLENSSCHACGHKH